MRCSGLAFLVSLLLSAAACERDSCEARAEGTVPLSTLAHATNEQFIRFHADGRPGKKFTPGMSFARMNAAGGLRLTSTKEEKFLTYASANGWNNQLLNLLCAIDMARLVNRTLIVPPFSWPQRRGRARAPP